MGLIERRWTILPAHEPGTNLPTPDPSQEGNWPASVAPLLGGAGGGFRGTMRAQHSGKSLPGQRAGVGETGVLDPTFHSLKMRRSKTNTLLIKTPEGIAFSLLLAGPVTRFLAWAMDMVCIGAICSLLGLLLGLLGLISIDLARALIVLACFIIQIG